MGIIEANGLSSRRYRWWVIFLFLAILFDLSTLTAQAAETFWGCLIYASDTGQCNSLPQRLSSYDARMSSVFGYSRFCLMTQRQTPLQAQKEAGLVFSDDLKIILTSLTDVSDGKYLIRLLFVEKEEPVMETQARVNRDSPLFIRGPNWRDGQIIIVIMVAA
jgi:hypothetical protein